MTVVIFFMLWTYDFYKSSKILNSCLKAIARMCSDKVGKFIASTFVSWYFKYWSHWNTEGVNYINLAMEKNVRHVFGCELNIDNKKSISFLCSSGLSLFLVFSRQGINVFAADTHIVCTWFPPLSVDPALHLPVKFFINHFQIWMSDSPQCSCINFVI